MKRNMLTTIAAAFVFMLTLSCTKESTQTLNSSAAATISSNITAAGDSIFIGAKYQGGIIFWIDASGQHGLIASDENIGDSAGTVWATDPRLVTGATKQNIGAGPANTRKIVNTLGSTTTYAAILCTGYHHKGYGDWFLPSIGELQQLMAQKDLIGGFPADNHALYASSTEAAKHSNDAMGISYQNSDNIALQRKDDLYNVRPVRKF